MKLGIDCLLQQPKLRRPLEGRRVALLGQPPFPRPPVQPHGWLWVFTDKAIS